MKRFEKDEDSRFVWFYWDGSRYGKVVKEHSKNHLTVEDVHGIHHQVKRNKKNDWISCRHKEFTGQNNLRGETDGNEKSKVESS